MSIAAVFVASSLSERLLSELAMVERFNEKDIHRSFAPGMAEREFRQLVWSVREQLRDQRGIEFRPTKARDGSFERATAVQKIQRGARFHRAAIRKSHRALDIVRSAEDVQLDDAGRRRKEAAENRIEQSMVFAQARTRRNSKV